MEGTPSSDLRAPLVVPRLRRDQTAVRPRNAPAVLASDLVSGPPGGDLQEATSRAKRVYQQSRQFSPASLSVEHLEVTSWRKGPPGVIW